MGGEPGTACCATRLAAHHRRGPRPLLRPLGSQVRTTPEAIKDYFRAFLKFKPQGVVIESHVQIMGPTLAAHYGIYTFTLANADASTKSVTARFSYTYRKEGGRWLIIEHHSSALPEPVLVAAPVLVAPVAAGTRGWWQK
jgi:uncharacterized protein (TIGR02246 family)